MPIDTDVGTRPESTENSSETIVFEMLADATDFVDLAYQPVCRVLCIDAT